MKSTHLRKQLSIRIEEALSALEIPDEPVSLYEPYRYAVQDGGKRIRPLLTVLANGLCGGNTKEALPAAMAVEILHNFTLVHDDIMDSAETRRGKPSVYTKWDQNTAILSGDVMFADAFARLLYYGEHSSFSKEEYHRILQVFLKGIVTVCEGQALDMEFVIRQDVQLDEYLRMIGGKTAALLEASTAMGAISAHATIQQQQDLESFAHHLGIAFQIQDDLLDATADPEKFGKKPGGDIIEGKKTYLTILASERATRAQNDEIMEVLEMKQAGQSDVERVLSLFAELNVISDVSDIVTQHYRDAIRYLDTFESSEYKTEMLGLVEFLKNREH